MFTCQNQKWNERASTIRHSVDLLWFSATDRKQLDLKFRRKKKILLKEKFQFFSKITFWWYNITSNIHHSKENISQSINSKLITTHLQFGVPQKNRIVSLEPQHGKFTCALMCSLRGQNGGQIWNQREILYKISFYQLWRTSIKSEWHTLLLQCCQR